MDLNSFSATFGISRLNFSADAANAPVFAAYVGEAVTLAFDAPLYNGTSFAPTVAVTRQPSGASLTFSNGSATPAVAGYYEITLTNAALPAQRVRFVALPAAALTAPAVKQPNRTLHPDGRVTADPKPRTEEAVRDALQRYVASTGNLAALDALSTNSPITTGVDWRLFAG